MVLGGYGGGYGGERDMMLDDGTTSGEMEGGGRSVSKRVEWVEYLFQSRNQPVWSLGYTRVEQRVPRYLLLAS